MVLLNINNFLLSISLDLIFLFFFFYIFFDNEEVCDCSHMIYHIM